ncbi:hypothetical protein OL548_15380 [Lysinibacillus sp. MHQ-1]|nr:hypothetical protein OL548_15380 [Lysinibacillus sp. MHQ-1]
MIITGGRQDIELRVIRAVGDADKRFAEDALRMLRAIRFSAQLDFTIAKDTMTAIQNRAPDIAFIAKERIKAELDKLWLGTSVFSGLQKLEESGLAAYLHGNFQAHRWYDFRTEDKHVGWAYFALLQGANWREILRDYRLSNKEMAFVKAVLTAYEALNSGWTNIHYFTYKEQELEAAIYFAKLLQLDVCLPSQPIRVLQDQLPIQQKQEVVVNGADLLKWSGKKGRPLGKRSIRRHTGSHNS